MTIFDYFKTATTKKLRRDLITSGKWTGWRSIPDDLEGFCEMLGVETDPRVDWYYNCTRGSYTELYLRLKVPAPDPIGEYYYSFGYTISGYDKPTIRNYQWGGYHGHVDYEFKGEKLVPNETERRIIYYQLTNDAVVVPDDKTGEITLGGIIEKTNEINELLGPCFDMVFHAFYGGDYAKYFERAGVKLVQGNYQSDGLCTPGFCNIANLLYLARKKFGYGLTVEDAVYLALYYRHEKGDMMSKPLINKDKKPDERINFVGKWMFWDRGSHREVENDTDTTFEKFAEMIGVARKVLVDNKDNNLEEYKKVLARANGHVMDKLIQGINEASRFFNIKPELLFMHGFTRNPNDLIDTHVEGVSFVPESWRLKDGNAD